MTLNAVMALILRFFSRNSTDFPADYITVVEDRPILSVKYCLRLLTFDQQVANVCKACYFHIRALRHVRQSLPDDVAKIVACSIVDSRLDYCNSLFVGMSDRNFKKLQRVQNTLA